MRHVSLVSACSTDRPAITGCTEFAELKASHNDIHKYATQSWQAKEDGNVELAMEYFNKHMMHSMYIRRR